MLLISKIKTTQNWYFAPSFAYAPTTEPTIPPQYLTQLNTVILVVVIVIALLTMELHPSIYPRVFPNTSASTLLHYQSQIVKHSFSSHNRHWKVGDRVQWTFFFSDQKLSQTQIALNSSVRGISIALLTPLFRIRQSALLFSKILCYSLEAKPLPASYHFILCSGVECFFSKRFHNFTEIYLYAILNYYLMLFLYRYFTTTRCVYEVQCNGR